ncbi:MAG: class I SAM-dependent methyltransferase [Cyanobacteria bacterium P01_A01_bin.80]
MDSNPALCEAIANRITASPLKRITFAEYMDMVLYHPKHGYYFRKTINLGREGDYYTSVHLGADFGELLAVQFIQIWEIMGKPPVFHLVELGAGQGYLAADVLRYILTQEPVLYQALTYIIIEKSPALIDIQQQRLKGLKVRWCNIEEIPNNSITGCFFSNELLDALPVHQLELETGDIKEIYVTTTDNLVPTASSNTGERKEFVEVKGEPSTLEISMYFDMVDVDIRSYSDGYRSEVNLNAIELLGTLTTKLRRGYILTIDYGYPATRYYNPRRREGTLQCYWKHHSHNDPYVNIGKQDITAHIDFTALEKWGEHYGLKKVGFTQQGLFLMSLGLGERIAALSYMKISIPDLIKRRDCLQQLLDPLGLGGFGVFVHSKGLTEVESAQQLKGFIEPI